MANSNACNCSSWHASLTSDHLLEFDVVIFFDKRCEEDSSIEMATSLASANSLITLEPSCSAEADFLLIFLDCFCTFLVRRMKYWMLA
uniref:Uncharacterized protein n=1 Tax=Oryza glumipatula TaxID=40148 RepID=A0A0E0AYP4_9ORYZ